MDGATEDGFDPLFSSFLDLKSLGDLTVEDQLRRVADSYEGFFAGMDSASNVIWMFFESKVGFGYYDGQTYDKQIFDLCEIRSSKPVLVINPVIFHMNGSRFALFTTGTEIVAARLFSSSTIRALSKLEGLLGGEQIIEMSNLVDNEFVTQESLFCSVTNYGSIYLHKVALSPRSDNVVIVSSRVYSPTNGSSSFKGFVSILFGNKPKLDQVNKARLTLTDGLMLTCLVDNQLRNLKIHPRGTEGCTERWSIDILEQREIDADTRLLDAEIVSRQQSISSIFALVAVPSISCQDSYILEARYYTFNENRNMLSRVTTSELRRVFFENPEKPAFGRLVQVGECLCVIFKQNDRSTVYKANIGNNSPSNEIIFFHQDIKHSVVGYFVLKEGISSELGLFISSGKMYRQNKSLNNNRSRFEDRAQFSYFAPQNRFPTQDQKVLGDIVINGFHDFRLERSSGIIRTGIEFEATYLDDLIVHMLSGIIVSKSGNIMTVRAVNDPQHRSTNALVKFDLELRLKTVEFLKKFLEQNNILHQATNRGRLAFIEASERLHACIVLRELEEQYPRSRLFHHQEFKTLEIYEKPRHAEETLKQLVLRRDNKNAEELKLLAELFIRLFTAIQQQRKSMLSGFKLRAVGFPWWSHDQTFLVATLVYDLYLAVKKASVYNDTLETNCLGLAHALIVELETANRAKQSNNLQETVDYIYKELLNSNHAEKAFIAAGTVNDLKRLANICIRENMSEKLVSLTYTYADERDLIKNLVDVAVEIICTADEDFECETALKVFQLKQIEPQVIAYVKEKYPQIAWLLLASSGDYSECLKFMPEDHVIPLAARALINKLENDRDVTSVQNILYQSYVEDCILPSKMKNAPAPTKIKEILTNDNLNPAERVTYAFMYASSNHHPRISIPMAELYDPIFKFLIMHDKTIENPKLMLHLRLWPLLSKAMTALEFKSYEECVRMGGFTRLLDEQDWRTVSRVMNSVGYDYERPTSQGHLSHSRGFEMDSDI